MDCNSCFYDYLAKCNLAIQVYAQLSPLTDYTWVIKDKFSNLYQGEFTTGSEGFWEIEVADLPAGMLTQYSGDFTLQVMDSGCKPVKFKIAQEYDCINFNIKGGNYEKDALGCSFECAPAAGSQTTLVSFTDDEEITITWTSGLLAAYGNSPVVQTYHLVSPSVYQLVDVEIQQSFIDGILTSVTVDNGGIATGYVLIS